MALTWAVQGVFGAKDEQSRIFDRMGRNAKKFGEKTERAFKKSSKSALNFKTIAGGILAAGGISRGLSLIGRGATAAATGFLEFDQAITSASAKFQGLDITTKEGQKTLLDLKKTAREVGATTEFSADQAASGLDFLALASFNADQAMALLPGVTNLATAAQIDLATATDIASDSLGAFGLMTKNTDQLTKNFTRIQDVMAKTTATSNTNLVQLFEAVQKGAPAFTAAGQSLESFNALAGIMANSGLKGAEAGTQLRNIMLRLSKPTKESATVLANLGVKTADAAGNFRDVVDILSDFEKGMKGMGSQQKSAALFTVFGARSVTGLNIVLKEGTMRLKSYRQMLVDSTGASAKMAEIMRSSLMNRLKSLGSAALEVGFQLFDAFDEKGAKSIDRLTMFIREIDLTGFIFDLKSIGTHFGQWGEILSEVVTTLKTFKELFPSLPDFSKPPPSFREFPEGVDTLNEQMQHDIDKFIKPFLKDTAELIKTGGVGNFFEENKRNQREQLHFGGGKNLGQIAREEGLFGVISAISQGSDFSNRAEPNRTAETSNQNVNVGGTLNIANAPQGSSFTPDQSAPAIDVNFVGSPPGGF